MPKKVAILGLAESGVGAAKLAHKLGFTLFLSDKGKLQDKYKQQLLEMGLDYEEGTHSSDEILNADIIIKSPGIPDKSALIVRFISITGLVIPHTAKRAISEGFNSNFP